MTKLSSSLDNTVLLGNMINIHCYADDPQLNQFMKPDETNRLVKRQILGIISFN